MGRTLPSITLAFLQEQGSFSDFRRALRRHDQAALDELFASARLHLAAAAYAAHPLPFETFLLAMLLEEHKKVQLLQQEVANLKRTVQTTETVQITETVQVSGSAQPSLPRSSAVND